MPAHTTAIGAHAGRAACAAPPSATMPRELVIRRRSGTQRAHRARLVGVDARRERAAARLRELAQRARDLLGGLARAVHELGHAGAQLAVVIDHDRRRATSA